MRGRKTNCENFERNMNNIKIPLDNIKNDFKLTLNLEGNSRMFFSGKFGIGKTYFLKEFFEQNKTEYEVFHMYPTNYQIYSNEDILELIKYDILVELLQKNSELIKDNDYNNLIDIQRLFYLWGKENLKDIFIAGVSLILKLGRPIKEVGSLINSFYQFKKRIEAGDKGIVDEFLKNIKEKSISETDHLSELLKQKITQYKGEKQSVLILDDLDRIDPEHIFRILNVFSAYFEKEHENKFGFDLVIVVADYKNIKNIFHHKYGKNTEFEGYLDKFYAIAPYYFDNKKAILDMTDEIAKSIKNEEPSLNGAIGENGYIKLFLEHFFVRTVESEIINLRELLKATRYQLTSLKKGSFREDPFSDNFQKIYDIAVKVIIYTFSSTDNFLKKINIIRNYKTAEKGHMPYGKYIETMLKALNIQIPDSNHKNVMWGNYMISKANDGFDALSVAEGREESLFYDLLIEYVQQKKYLKNNLYDYQY